MPHGTANIIPNYRKKAVFGKIKKNLGAVFHGLARRRECRIEAPAAGLCTNILRTNETFSHQTQILILQTRTVIFAPQAAR
jgi:hypothetical protein